MSAWVARERDRDLGQELTEEPGRVYADLMGKAGGRDLGARKQFKVSTPVKFGPQSSDIADTRRALTWKEVGGKKTAKDRPVAKGYQDPNLRDGSVDSAGCG